MTRTRETIAGIARGFVFLSVVWSELTETITTVNLQLKLIKLISSIMFTDSKMCDNI